MVEIVGFPLSRPASSRLAIIGVVAVASLMLPLVGVPLAFGLAGYLTISLSRPNKVVRGRTLSAAQHRRAAIVVGGAVFALAIVFSATLSCLDLASGLEAQLYDRVEAAASARALQLDDTVFVCEGFACARATVIKLATPKTLGLLEFHGFALHDVRSYGWRQPAVRAEGDRPRGSGQVR
jgi:hypothetical protein